MKITALYAALLALLFLVLSFRVVGLRRARKLALGWGNFSDLERAIAAHSNFAEYIPLALMLLFSLESLGAARWALHVLGGALLIGRCLHSFGVSQNREDLRFRVAGMIMTFTAIGLSVLGALYLVATA